MRITTSDFPSRDARRLIGTKCLGVDRLEDPRYGLVPILEYEQAASSHLIVVSKLSPLTPSHANCVSLVSSLRH